MSDRCKKHRLRCAAGTARRTVAATVMLTAVCGVAAMAAAEDKPVPGREALIGKLIPITGDPLERRSVELRIGFRVNSAELAEDAAAPLRELGAALVSEALRDAALGIYGHTDASGPADYNLALSERRAQAVAAFLREQAGIAAERFREVRGYGEKQLREDLPPGAAAQRRVEIAVFHELAAGRDRNGAEEAGASEPDGKDEEAVTVTGGSDEAATTAPETDGNDRKRGADGNSGYRTIQ